MDTFIDNRSWGEPERKKPEFSIAFSTDVVSLGAIPITV
jgi:hypothetical protein